MADQKNPQNTNLTDPNKDSSQSQKPQWVFGWNVDAFDAIAQQWLHQPDEKKDRLEKPLSSHSGEPIDPFLQSWADNAQPKEENVDIPDPFLVDEEEILDTSKNDTKNNEPEVEQEEKNIKPEKDWENRIDSSVNEDVSDNSPQKEEKNNDTTTDTMIQEDIANVTNDSENKDQDKQTEKEGTQPSQDNDLQDSYKEENKAPSVPMKDIQDHSSENKNVTSGDSREQDMDQDIQEDEELKNTKEDIDEPTVTEEHEEEPVKDKSALQEKFQTLLALTKETLDIHTKINEGSLSLVWSDNDISFVEYTFEQSENTITIHKNSLDKKTNENEEHILSFALDGDEEVFLHVIVDDTLLFNEKDIVDDKTAQVQIMDKLSKFLFLMGQEKKSLDKEYEEYKEKKSKKEKVQTFRNF